jgi:hypothetical protein
MPSLYDEIKQSANVPRQCVFARWLSAQPDDIREDVEKAMADPMIPAQRIADVLHNRFELRVVDQIREHRRGACRVCPNG